MRAFADQTFLQVWYVHLDIEQALGECRSQFTAKRVKETEKMVAKARTRDSTQALGKLTTLVDGRRRIISECLRTGHPGLALAWRASLWAMMAIMAHRIIASWWPGSFS